MSVVVWEKRTVAPKNYPPGTMGAVAYTQCGSWWTFYDPHECTTECLLKQLAETIQADPEYKKGEPVEVWCSQFT